MKGKFYELIVVIVIVPFTMNGMDAVSRDVERIKGRTRMQIALFDFEPVLLNLNEDVRKSLIAELIKAQEAQIVALLEQVESDRYQANVETEGLAISEQLEKSEIIWMYTRWIHCIICQAGNALSNRTKLRYLGSFDSKELRKEVIKNMIEYEGIHPDDINPNLSPLYEGVSYQDIAYVRYLCAHGASPDKQTLVEAQRNPEIMALFSGVSHE